MKREICCAVALAALLFAPPPAHAEDLWEVDDVIIEEFSDDVTGHNSSVGFFLPSESDAGASADSGSTDAGGATTATGTYKFSRSYTKVGNPGNLTVTLDYSGHFEFSINVQGMGGSNSAGASICVAPGSGFVGADSVEGDGFLSLSSGNGGAQGPDPDDDSAQSILNGTAELDVTITLSTQADTNALGTALAEAQGGTAWSEAL